MNDIDGKWKKFVGTKIKMEEVPDGLNCEPTLTITKEAAQGLMDQLWACGLRPSEGSGSAGALAATERHLADMQKLVFNLVEKVA